MERGGNRNEYSKKKKEGRAVMVAQIQMKTQSQHLHTRSWASTQPFEQKGEQRVRTCYTFQTWLWWAVTEERNKQRVKLLEQEHRSFTSKWCAKTSQVGSREVKWSWVVLRGRTKFMNFQEVSGCSQVRNVVANIITTITANEADFYCDLHISNGQTLTLATDNWWRCEIWGEGRGWTVMEPGSWLKLGRTRTVAVVEKYRYADARSSAAVVCPQSNISAKTDKKSCVGQLLVEVLAPWIELGRSPFCKVLPVQ